jgi:small subunit ribosomal protein S4
MARQFVSHGHILVNGKKLSIPSYRVKVGDVITITDKMKKNPAVMELAQDEERIILPFLKKQGFIGKLERMPKLEDVQVPFDLQLIIEYYSR